MVKSVTTYNGELFVRLEVGVLKAVLDRWVSVTVLVKVVLT